MMKTAKDLELSLLLKEKQIQDLKLEKIHLIENGLILRKRIDKAIEYIKEKYDYILKDDTFLDHDERIDRKQILRLLDILKGVDKDEIYKRRNWQIWKLN